MKAEIRLEQVGQGRYELESLARLGCGETEPTAKDLIDSLSEQERNELTLLMNGSYRFVLNFDK